MSSIQFDKSELPNCEEISRDECFSSFLSDDDLTDLSLKSNDGVTVRASRHILAARSSVFRSMLLGKFSEAKKDTIPLDFQGLVLKAIVEYILTDSAEILRSDESVTNEHTQTLVSLMEGAIYFNLPVLCEKVFLFFGKSLHKQPSLSFMLLEACNNGNNPAVLKQLRLLAVSHLRTNIEIMDTNSIAVLSASTLEDILKDDKIQVDEHILFELVKKWAETHREQLPVEADVLSKAREMVKKHIHLEWIDPGILSTSVASSDLVSQELLLEAFKLQAMTAKEKHNVIFKRLRSTPVWNSSKSDTSTEIDSKHTGDMLVYHTMSSGVHRWTVEVVQMCNATWLGVASTSIQLNMLTWLGGQEGGWMYGSNGSACNNGTEGIYDCIHPTYMEGSKVTLTLDLTPSQAKNGTLSASLDGGDPFVLFENMRGHLGENGEGGFVPAVSLCCPGYIRLLAIERVQ